MSRTPSWARDNTESRLEYTDSIRAEEAADIALGAAGVAVKQAKKVRDSLPPPPDPRQDVNYLRLAGLEESFLARLSPRRNRWPEIVSFDERVTEIDRRQAEIVEEIVELEARRQNAEPEYRAALAAWLDSDQTTPKPEPETPQLEERLVALAAERDAQDVRRQRVLEEKIEFIKKQRSSLTRTAEQETAKALEHCLDLVNQLREARAELLEARANQTWAALYPDPLTSATMGHEQSLALGLLKPVREALGLTQQIAAERVFAALEMDATVISERLTPEQRQQLGFGPEPTPETIAMWHEDPRAVEWTKRKQRELNEIARSALPIQQRGLGQEMAD